ncbi:MAG: hypothetical protein RCG15_06970 [Candidatus Rickettsia vulgarisii]
MHQSIFYNHGNERDYQVIMVIADKVRFENENHGGSIYILPARDFCFDESKGLGIYEWTSKQIVDPILQINFDSSLDAMQKLGVL